MDVLSIILMVLLALSVVGNVLLFLFYRTLKRQFDVLKDVESFEEQLLLHLIAISESVVQDVNKFFSESLISSIPEMQALMMYVRRMRDLYRSKIQEYNANNTYRNRIVVQEFLEESGETKETKNG